MKSNKKSTRIVIATVVIVLLAGIFLILKQWQSPQDQKRLVFLGGSQLDGLVEPVSRYLNAATGGKYKVDQVILPAFAVTGLNQYHQYVNKNYSPDVIVSLIACASSIGDANEAVSSNIDRDKIPLDSPAFEHIAFFSLPLSEIDKVATKDVLEKATTALTAIAKADDLQNLKTFSFLSPYLKMAADDLPAFDELIQKLALDRLTRGVTDQHSWENFEQLLILGQKTRSLRAKHGQSLPAFEMDFYRKYSPETGKIENVESEMFQPMQKFIDEGLAQLKTESCENFVAQSETSLVYNRLWLCGIQQRTHDLSKDAKIKLINNSFSSRSHYFMGFQRPLLSNLTVPATTSTSYFKVALARLNPTFDRKIYDDPDESLSKPTAVESFVKNIQIFKSSADKNHQRFLLLQVPNLHEDLISETGKKFEVPVIESHGLFDQTIAEKGRAAVFTKFACGGGDLTADANDKFAKHVADELVKILESQNAK